MKKSTSEIWPATAIPQDAEMGRWLRRALQDRADMPTANAKNDVSKARTLAAQVLRVAGGDLGHARALATLGWGEASCVARIHDSDPKLALELGLAKAAGKLPHGALTRAERRLDAGEPADAEEVPPWPLEEPDGPVEPTSHWSKIALASARSGLNSAAFAALHGIKRPLARRCVMTMTAARRIAWGDGATAKALSAQTTHATLQLDALRRSDPERFDMKMKAIKGMVGGVPASSLAPIQDGVPEGSDMETQGNREGRGPWADQ